MRGALSTAAVVAAISAVLFGPTLLGGFPLDASHGGDLYTLSALFDRLSHHLGRGDFPWYFPEFGSGSPVAAGWMYGLFSPPTLIFLLLPAGPAWVWSTVLHLALAAFGMHLLSRQLGMRHAAAATAGIAYAVSEWMIGRALCGHLNLVWAAAWAPLVFWAVSRAAAGKGRSAATLGLLLGFGLLSGHVQVWFYVGPVLAAFALGELHRGGFKRRSVAALGLGGLLAAGITATQWSFTFEYFSSLGDISVPKFQHPVFTTPGIVMAAKPFPGFLGHPPEAFRGGAVFFQESYATGGLGVLLLAALGVADRRRGRWFWLAVLVFGLLVAGGYRNPVSSFLNRLPVLSSGRAAGRALHLAVLAAAVLAGRGADAWLDPLRRPSRRRLAAVALCLGAIAGGCLLVLRLCLTTPGAFHEGLPAVFASLLSAAAVAGGLLCSRRRPRAAILVPATALAAVLIAGLPPVRPIGDEFYRRLPVEVTSRQARDERVFLAGWGSLPVLEQHGVRTTRPVSPVDSEWYAKVLVGRSFPLHRWLGIGVYVDSVKTDALLEDPGPLHVLSAWEAMPPGSLFPGAERGVPDDEAVFRLEGGEMALLLPEDAPALPVAEARIDRESVEVVREGPGRIEFRTRARRSRWLYVAEKYYDDWRATIDGTATEIHRANVAGMAIAVPAGEHTVLVRYRPDAATWGPIASLVSVLLAFGMLLRRRRGAVLG